MKVINKTSPEGNVFFIIAYVKQNLLTADQDPQAFQDEMLSLGSYDVILDTIEKRYPQDIQFVPKADVAPSAAAIEVEAEHFKNELEHERNFNKEAVEHQLKLVEDGKVSLGVEEGVLEIAMCKHLLAKYFS